MIHALVVAGSPMLCQESRCGCGIANAQCWDLAGAHRYRSIVSCYMRGGDAYLVGYDITSRESFSQLREWIDALESHGDGTAPITIMGHKADLEDVREVTFEEGAHFAATIGAAFFESSAKTGQNVHVAMASVLRSALIHNATHTPQ
eukprot:TRINITY_DN49995_c0_g1_i2.p2 TRINITY_DN49995_c0_g1~~TRINITY_DN49995_c0_g1_i2.p2  ORF type:complete len:147 (-),score=36.12 TRINITY_DN49995_c0_g1_i2:531-971(-)